MSLVNKFLQKKVEKEYFIVLGIEEHRICAAVAEIEATMVRIIGTGESEYATVGSEIEATDIAISTAEKSVPENIFVKKTIFGVPVSFMQNGEIKPEYMERVQKISKELDLSPQGYIEYPQAISSFLETKEETPPTLLLLSIGRNHLTLTHLRVGKVEKNIVVERSSSLSEDFNNMLSHFESEILPSKIVMYDEVKGPLLEDMREELLNFPWHKQASFMHTPKIEIMEPSAITTALVETAASKFIRSDLQVISQSEEKSESTATVNSKEETVKENESNIRETPTVKRLTEKENHREEEAFGFVKNKDIRETEELENISTPVDLKTELFGEKFEEPQKPDRKLIPNIPNIPLRFPPLSFSLAPALGVLLVLILIAFVGYFLVWNYPQSDVNLIVYPLKSSQTMDVVFTTDNTRANLNNNIILATTISQEISDQKTIETTGKTKVGNPAKGDATIYNKTLEDKTFPKGTVLTNGSLKFTLDNDTTIASASDTGEGLTYGKTTTSITAVDIGPEGNLSADSNFTIKDFPGTSYYAKNTSNFSGGTSRDVSSVSKEDQDNLFSSLSQDLEGQAKQKMLQQIGSDEKLLDGSIENTVVSQKFSNDVNTEAKELTLTLDLKVNALVYKQKDLTTLAKTDLFQPPQGYTINNSQNQIKIEQAQVEKNGDTQATAVITANFIPKFDTSSIKSQITGKSFQTASNTLSKINNIGGIEIIKGNNLPLWGNMLPLNGNNININLVIR
ncbi:baseplate J/gp47 family protein [Patescibacteria group bacterium]|nr:baseplate J/gp47 family protein [Patescibacteria group bacterium]